MEKKLNYTPGSEELAKTMAIAATKIIVRSIVP
jgi:hypothetical protein